MRPKYKNLVNKSDAGGFLLLITSQPKDMKPQLKNRVYEILVIFGHPFAPKYSSKGKFWSNRLLLLGMTR